MKASLSTLDDGTVTIVIEAEDAIESQLLTVFTAQTYRKHLPAKVLCFGRWKVQLIAQDRVSSAPEETASTWEALKP